MAIATLVADAFLIILGIGIVPKSALGPFQVLGAFMGFSYFVYRGRIRPNLTLFTMAACLVVLTWTLLMVGAIPMSGLAVKAPFIDPVLIRADAALGLHIKHVVLWIADRPALVPILGSAYNLAVPAVLATAPLLALAKRYEDAWIFCASIGATALICVLVGAAAPALGAFDGHGLTNEFRALLPPGAGVFHFDTVNAWRSGQVTTVDLERLEGVVTFPSCHASMGVATAVFMDAFATPGGCRIRTGSSASSRPSRSAATTSST